MDNEMVAVLIRDAMSDFINKRMDAESYVRSRYTWMNEEQKKRKVCEVCERIRKAHRIMELSRDIADWFEVDIAKDPE